MEHEQRTHTRFRRASLRVRIMLYGEQPDCLAWFASVDAGTATLAAADRIRALNASLCADVGSMPPHHRRIAKQASHLLDIYEHMARHRNTTCRTL